MALRLLADVNMPRPTLRALSAVGHDVLWAGHDFSGLRDRDLLLVAARERRILLTLDSDYLHIARQWRGPEPVAVIWLRPRSQRHAVMSRLLAAHLQMDREWWGVVTVIEPDGIQVYEAPDQSR